jgi:class 3 adenylate cyclase/TolB-like protein/Tfp pilus assembly protein PilF
MEHVDRRLTAVLAADVAGYSRLMGGDEEGTLAQLKELQRVLLEPKIAEHRGRIVKTTGDGMLVEFASVVEAVRYAIEIQRAMAERNAAAPPGKRVEFRVGINVGDIIIEGEDIFGDGVNIAARLEQIARPGGICLSEDAYRQVRGKLDAPIGDAGEQNLKNISHPVRVYRIEPSVTSSAVALPLPAAPEWRWLVRAVMAAALAVTLAVFTWFALLRDRPDISKSAEQAKPIAVSGIPIVAVLPFANQTGDDSQGYFADGVTEEVINALGRFNTLRVIGRNAVLRYKQHPPSQEEIASDLGANYLLAGSVSRSGKRVRVAAQLTESGSGIVKWADRYDGELADIFDFQDAMARQIAGTLAANIAIAEGRRSLAQPKPNPNAFDLALQARAVGHASTRTANRRFRELIAKAIELDPNYAAAHALLADALYSQAILGWTESAERELSRGADEARKAISLAPNEPDGYRALGRILLARAQYDQAQNALKRAIAMNPSDATALATWGAVQSFSGEIAGAIDSLQLALKLDSMLEPNYVFDLAIAYYLARRHEDALHVAERGLAHYPSFAMLNVPAAAAAAQLGRKEQAADYVEAIRLRLPLLDPETLGSRFKNPSHPAYLREGLKEAGF